MGSIGHEYVGVVEAVGEDVQDLTVGDFVEDLTVGDFVIAPFT